MKMNEFRVLMLGDAVGPASVTYLSERLWKIRDGNSIDLVICNAENCAAGNGIDKAGAEKLLASGADVLTTGNHAFKKYDAPSLFEENARVLRPANYPGEVPGHGYTVVSVSGLNVLVISMLGVVMLEPLDSPFGTLDAILERNKGKYDFAFADIHAEATSEKLAFAYYANGRLNGIFGTHTHVTTADEKLIRGAAYITDVGMCGPEDSILGVEPDIIVGKLRNHLPARFSVSENEIKAHGVIATYDRGTGKTLSVERITF